MVSGAGRRCFTSLMLFIKRLHTYLHRSRRVGVITGIAYDQAEEREMVPDDVKEGCFAILAVKNEEKKPARFVAELGVLKNPAFLRLLKLAEEEYGFNHKGALAIPCQPNELQKILGEKTGGFVH